MKGLKNKHKDIVGQAIRKNHLPQWDEQHYLEFFAMVHHFAPRGEWMWNDLAIKTFCQQGENRPLWEEWKWRYQMEADKNPGNIGKPIMGFIPIIGSHLQSNPHIITPRMREIMKGNSRLEKYTEPFKIVQTAIGTEIVVPNTDEGQVFTLPEVQYHKAILHLSALANELSAGITPADIKKMSVDERLKISLNIVKTLSQVQGGQKPNIDIFKQLVINQAGREDLEKAMLAYNQE